MSEIKNKLIALFMVIAVFAMMFLGGSFHFEEKQVTETEAPAQTIEPTVEDEIEPTVEPTEEPVIEQTTYTISLIGDITPDSVAAFRYSDVGYYSVVGDDSTYVFEYTRQYFVDDDFTIANFECVMSDNDLTAEDKTFTFISPTSYTDTLIDGSVEFVTLGNNHVLDYGLDGYADTKEAMEDAGIAYAGRDEYTLYETESGLLIGVYAVSFGTVEQIEAGIAALKDLGAEFIIAAIHWGDEGSYDVNSSQIEQGHAAIDAGADLVYGTHPHTLQPIEYYNGKYIFYSMGNWSFGGNTDPRDKDTVIAQLTLTRQDDGTVVVSGIDLIPCASSGVESGNNYQPVPYEEGSEDYERTLTKLDGSYSGANLTIGYEYGVGELAID